MLRKVSIKRRNRLRKSRAAAAAAAELLLSSDVAGTSSSIVPMSSSRRRMYGLKKRMMRTRIGKSLTRFDKTTVDNYDVDCQLQLSTKESHSAAEYSERDDDDENDCLMSSASSTPIIGIAMSSRDRINKK